MWLGLHWTDWLFDQHQDEEAHEYIQLQQPENAAMAEFTIILEHSIQLHNTSTLSSKL
jgi:hypothetical protein